MTDIAIKVSNLSKCYQIYDNPRDRLRQFIAPRLQRMIGQAPKQYFREFWALKEVSFEIKKGETVGIIRRNGSGKPTLLKLICGTLNPTSGSVTKRPLANLAACSCWTMLGWGFILSLDFDLNRQGIRADFDLTKGYLMTTTEKLYKAAQDLPEPVIVELLDFAEFLRSKTRNRPATSSNELLVDLMGGLKKFVTFAGESLAIQKRLRDEWQ